MSGWPLLREFVCILALGLFGGLLAYRRPSAPRLPQRAFDVLFLAAAALFCVVYATMAVLRHNSFHSHAYDMAVYGQVMWNLAQGRLFANTIIPGYPNFLADHFSPILLALVPFQWVFQDLRWLLLAQPVILALGAVPIYWWAKERLGIGILPFALGVAFLLYPALAWITVLDFHPLSLATPLMGFALYALLRGRMALFFVLSLALLLVREDMGLAVFALGAYAALTRWRRLGMTMAVAGLLTSLLLMAVVMPSLHPQEGPQIFASATYVRRYPNLGGSLAEIAATLIGRPLFVLGEMLAPPKLLFWGHYLVPLALLPLLGPSLLALSLPLFAVLLLGPATWPGMVESHYGAPLVPFVFFAAVEGCRRLVQWGGPKRPAALKRALATAILLCSALAWYLYGPGPFNSGFDAQRYILTEHGATAYEVMAQISPEARVMAQTDLAPHLSQREVIYMFPWIHDMTEVDHILLDRQGNDWPLDSPEGAYERAVARLLADAAWETAMDRDGYLLLRRAEPGMMPLPSPARFGSDIELVGYHLDRDAAPPGEAVEVTLYWQALGPVGENYTAFVHLVDEAGRRWGQADAEPTGLLYRTSEWETSKLLKGTHQIAVAPDAPTGTYHLEVGLYLLRTMERLPTAEGDKIRLGRFRVELRG